MSGQTVGANHPEQPERRQYVRIKKNYIIRFSDKANPSVNIQVSQVENISRGGVCFNSAISFAVGTNVAIEMRTPYLAESIYFEGNVLGMKELVKGMIYQNHVKFHDLSARANDVLDKIEKYNTH
jgi:hypothetical protein